MADSSLSPLEENAQDTADDVIEDEVCAVQPFSAPKELSPLVLEEQSLVLEEQSFLALEEAVFFDCLYPAKLSSSSDIMEEPAYFDCSSSDEMLSSMLDSALPFDVFPFESGPVAFQPNSEDYHEDLFYDALAIEEVDPFYDAFQVFPSLPQPIYPTTWMDYFSTPWCLCWSSMSTFLFFSSALLWDTLEYIVTPSPSGHHMSRHLCCCHLHL